MPSDESVLYACQANGLGEDYAIPSKFAHIKARL